MTPAAERYFERRQIHAAIEFARGGGIAVHRNFDIYDGRVSARGFVMRRPFLHVIGLRPALEEWAARYAIPVAAIQAEKQRGVAHIDVFGELAERLIARLRGRERVVAEFENFTRSHSALYAQLAAHIAHDDEVLDLAMGATPGQPAPNLLFGAVHYLLLRGVGHPLARFYPTVTGDRTAPPAEAFPDFRDFCLLHSGDITRLVSSRRVQTNEVGRCAPLLPALATAEGLAGEPLALVEIGASAGLNLRFDRYGYEFGARRAGDPHSPVQIPCELRGELRPPLRVPAVRGRLGVDLEPVDATDPDQALWLRALVWPDQPERQRLLLAAIACARDDPPEVIAGDAAERLPDAAARAGAGRLCVMSSFVEFQLGEAGRARLEESLVALSRERPLLRVRLEWEFGVRPWLDIAEYDRGEAGPRRRLGSAQEHGGWLRWEDPASTEEEVA